MRWIFLICMLMFGKLSGEVVQLTLYWNSFGCNDICVQMLKKNFGTIYGVSDIFIDQPAGRGDLFWKPNVPLDYEAINTARKFVGIGLRQIRIKVRGTLGFDNGQYTLTSLGDNTFFKLLAGVELPETKYASRYHRFSPVFAPDKDAKLKDAIAKHNTVTIDGELHYPYRGPPLMIIAQFIKVEERELD